MEIVSGNERDIARKNAKDKEESLHQTIVKLAVIMVTIATLIVFAATTARITSDAIKEYRRPGIQQGGTEYDER